MGENGDRPVQSHIDQALACGIVEVIVAANDMGDSHVMVVDDDGQIIGRRAV